MKQFNIITLCLCLLLFGCNKPYEWEQYQEFQPRLDVMKFTASVKVPQSDAAADVLEKFQAGQEFGLWSVIRGPREELKPSGNFLDNMKFTSNAEGEISSAEELVWPDEILHFYAYYPYIEDWQEQSLEELDYSLPLNQNELTDDGEPLYFSADILYANEKGVRPNTPVDLLFSHLMGNIVINVKSGIRNPDVTLLPIEITGAAVKAIVNMETGNVIPDYESVGTIIPYESGTDVNRVCRAVMLPQTLDLAIETEFKGEPVKIEKKGFEIRSGWQYIFELVIDDTGIRFVLGDVKPWEGLESEQILSNAEKVKIPYLINIPDFSDSFVYKVMIGENKQIAEICNEYLYKSGEFVDEEGTVALDHKAIVAYPMRDNGEGQMVADHSNGFVLQLMKETVDGKTVSYAVDDAPIHGGKVVFDSKGMLEYIPGNSAPVDKFYYIDKAFSTDSFDECQTASIEAEVISDDPSRYDQGVSNVYRITKIGSQYWTVDNLRASKYNDGESIRYFAPDETTGWAGTAANRPGKYTWYKDTDIDVSSDAAYKNVYGALYNWTAICNGGGRDVTFPYNVEADFLAPAGWKVPFRDDYRVLYSYLGENKPRMIRGMMKADMAAEGAQPDRASAQWAYDATRTFTNITNFSAINSGYCNSSKAYFSDTFYMYFATSNASTRAYGFKLPFDAGTDDKYLENHWWALSIRCIKAD